MKNKLSFFIVSFILLSSCRDIPTPVVNPCDGAKRLKADFSICELVVDTLINVENDTSLAGNSIYFTALNKYDSVKWTIGKDYRTFTDSNFHLNFDGFVGKIDVRLIAYRMPNTQCFIDDKGTDTLIKTFYVKNTTPIIYGYYSGFIQQDPQDTFIVSFAISLNGGLIMKNINKGCNDSINENGGYIEKGTSNRVIRFWSGGTSYKECQAPDGIAILDKNNKDIIINYTAGRAADRKSYKFIGTRRQP